MPNDEAHSGASPLESWKAIAAHLNRDVRTVMRWEKTEGLPVHRHRHAAGSTVYAHPAELDAWRTNRRVEPVLSARSADRPRRLPTAAFAATLSLALLVGGGGRLAESRSEGVVERAIGWPDDASMAADASMSPDGRYISFVDQTTTELHVKDLRTGRERQLTRIGAAGGYIEGSAISRDGRLIAFASKDAGPSFVTAKLRLLPIDADDVTPPRVLAEGQWFKPQEWSRDDRELLVVVDRADRRVDIALVTVATGDVKLLKRFDRPSPGRYVRRSPDGKMVAYDVASSPTERQRDIYLLRTDNSASVPLLTGPSSDSVVGWSPDGRYLIFRSDRRGASDLWTLPVAGDQPAGEPTLLRPEFDAETHTITNRGHLFVERSVSEAGGSHVTQLMTSSVDMATGTRIGGPTFAAHDRRSVSRFPRWSADGTKFMYLTVRPGGRVVSIRTIATGQVSETPVDLNYIWTCDWSPDARQIVFRASDPHGRDGIFLFDVESGKLQLIVSETGQANGLRVPQFGNDGRTLTYFRRTGDKYPKPGRTSYVERNLEDGKELVLELPDVGEDLYAMGRSPDRRFLLAINFDRRKVPTRLFAYDVAIAQMRELFSIDRGAAFNYEDGLQWMPDSRALVANIRGVKRNQFDLWWIPLDGRPPHQLDIGVRNLVNRAIAVHPDGRQVSFSAGDPIPSHSSSPRREFRLLENFLPK